MLTIALPKGRLADQTLDIMEKADSLFGGT